MDGAEQAAQRSVKPGGEVAVEVKEPQANCEPMDNQPSATAHAKHSDVEMETPAADTKESADEAILKERDCTAKLLMQKDNELKVYASELARTQEALAALRKQARKYAKEAKHAKKGAALTAKKLENTHIELEQSESMSFVQLESLAEELEREVQSKETIIHEQRLALEKAHSAQLAAAGADQKRAAELRAQENQLGVDRDAVAAQLAGMDVKEAELTAARAENELLLGNVEDLKQKLSASMESTEAARSELAAGHGQSIGGAQSNGHEVEALKAQLAASQEAHRTAIASLQEQLRGKSSLIMELQAQIQEHVEMLEELQCSNGDASQRTLELESVQSQLDEITAELKASKHECSLAKAETVEKEAEVQTLLKMVEELDVPRTDASVEEKLAAARQKSDEMEEELKDMVEQLMNAENEISKAMGECEVLRAARDSAQNSAGTLEYEVDEVRAALEDVRVQLEAVEHERTDSGAQTAEIKRLKALTEELQEQMKRADISQAMDLEDQLQSTEAEKLELMDCLARSRAECHALQVSIEESAVKLSAAQLTAEELSAEKAEILGKHDAEVSERIALEAFLLTTKEDIEQETQSVISILKAELEGAKSALEGLNAQQNELSGKCNAQAGEIQRLKALTGELQGCLDDSMAQIQTTRETIEKLTAEREELAAGHEVVVAERSALHALFSSTKEEMEQDMHRTRTELDEARAALEDARAQLDVAEYERRDSGAKDAEIQRLKALTEELQEQMTRADISQAMDLEDQLHSAEAECQAVQGRLDESVAELQTARQTVVKLEAEKEEITARHDALVAERSALEALVSSNKEEMEQEMHRTTSALHNQRPDLEEARAQLEATEHERSDSGAQTAEIQLLEALTEELQEQMTRADIGQAMDMEDQLHSAETEKLELMDCLEHARAECQALQRDLEESAAKLSAAQQTAEDLSVEKAAMIATHDAVASERSTLQALFCAAKEELARKDEQLGYAQAELEAAERTEQQVVMLQQDLHEALGEASQQEILLKEQVTGLTVQLEAVRAELHTQTFEVEALYHQLAEADQEIAVVNVLSQDARRDMHGLSTEMLEAAGSLQQAKQAMGTLESGSGEGGESEGREVGSEEVILGGMWERVQFLESALEESAATEVMQSEEVHALRGKIALVQRELKAATQEIELLYAEKYEEDMESDVNEAAVCRLSIKLKDKEAQLRETAAKLQQATTAISDLRSKLASTTSREAELETQAAAQLKNVEHKMEQAREQQRVAENTMDVLAQETDALQTELRASQQEIHDLCMMQENSDLGRRSVEAEISALLFDNGKLEKHLALEQQCISSLEQRLMQAETQLDMAKQEAAIEDALVREDVSTLKTQLSATRRELQATAFEVQSAYGKHANTEEALHTKEVEVQVLSRRLSSIDAEVGMLSARLHLALTQLSGNETAACGVTDAAASLANSVSLLEAYVVEHHQMQEEAQSASAEEIRQLQERISALEQEMATVEEHTRAQVIELQERATTQGAKLETAFLQAAEAEQEIQRQTARIFDLECALESASQELVVQEERAAAGRASQATKLSESERELQAATDELQALYLNLEGMENELKTQEADAEALRIKLRDAEAKFAAALTELEASREAVQARDVAIGEAEEARRRSEGELESGKEELTRVRAALEAEEAASVAAAGSHAQRVSELEAALHAVQNDNDAETELHEKQVAELLERLHTRDVQVKEAQVEVEQLYQKLSDIEQQQNADVAAMQSELDTRTHELSEARAEAAASITQLNESLKASEAAAELSKAEAAELAEHLAQSAADVKKLDACVGSLESRLEESSAETDRVRGELEAELDDKRRVVAELEGRLAEAETASKAAAEQAEHQVAAAESALERAVEDAAQVRMDLNATTQKLEVAQQAMAAAEEEKSQAQAELEAAAGRAEYQVAAAESALERAVEDAAQVRVELKSATQQFEAAQQAVAAAVEEKSQAQAELEAAAGRVRQLQDGITAVRKETGEAVVLAQAANQQLQTELEDAVMELETERQAKASLQEDYQALKLAALPKEQGVVDVKAEGSLKAQISYMEAQVRATQQEMDSIVAKCETLVLSNNSLKRNTEKLSTRLLFEKRKMEKVKKTVAKAPVVEEKENVAEGVKTTQRRNVEFAGLPSTGSGEGSTPYSRNRKKSCNAPTPAAIKNAPHGLPRPGSTPAKVATSVGEASTPGGATRQRSTLGEVQNVQSRAIRQPAKGTPVPREALARGSRLAAEGMPEEVGRMTDGAAATCVTPPGGKSSNVVDEAEGATPSTLSRVYSGMAGAVGGVLTTPRRLYRSLSGAAADQE